MSLIRCPGCKIDTSDSLAHCPNCGIGLGGGGPRLFDQPSAAFQQAPPREAPSTNSGTSLGSPPTPIAIGGTGKAILVVIGLVVLALVPVFIPFAVMALIFWQFAKMKKTKSSPQIEALKIFVNEVSRARPAGSKERPLDMLRRIEQQIKNQRNA